MISRTPLRTWTACDVHWSGRNGGQFVALLWRVACTAAVVLTTTEPSAERVLLVAHEPRLRESIRAHLALDRYRCDAVDDGQAALQQARETPFDLIVVDLAAPNVAGSQISRALRHQPMNRRAPIVIIA